MQTFYSSKL
jgi:predicted secreted acid phosphatase